MNKIVEFQKDNGLVADGVLGKKTFAKMMEVWNIKFSAQLANFLGQGSVESVDFTKSVENLNYSSKGLSTTFKKYFPTIELANKYARQPEKIADRAYASRMGNGDEASGDGWKHRGAGEMMLTGFDNYRAFSEWLGIKDRVLTTDEIANKYFWQTGLYYFEVNGLWKLATSVDDVTITKLSKVINLGNANSKATPNGLVERLEKTKHFYKLITT